MSVINRTILLFMLIITLNAYSDSQVVAEHCVPRFGQQSSEKSTSSQNEERRDQAIESIQDRFNNAQETAERTLVYEQAQRLLTAVLRECDDSFAEHMGEFEAEVNQLILQGELSEYDRLTSSLEYVTSYREPTPELESIITLAQTLRQKLPDRANDFPDVTRLQLKQYITMGRLSSESRRGTCSNVLRREYPLTRRDDPSTFMTRHQGGIGWCYAFSTSDLLGFKLGQHLSPVAIANSFNNSPYGFVNSLMGRSGSDIEAGAAMLAVRLAVANNALCLESELPTHDQALENPGAFYSLYRSLERITREHSPGDAQGIEAELCSMNDQIETYLPGMELPLLLSIIAESSDSSLLNNLVQAQCRTTIGISYPIRVHDVVGRLVGKDRVMSTIDEQISAGNIVEISYHSNVLRDHTNTFGMTDGHSSTVIGRRFNEQTQECEFIVRNSWGNGCGSYDEEYYCDQGNVYIPERILREAVEITTYIEMD